MVLVSRWATWTTIIYLEKQSVKVRMNCFPGQVGKGSIVSTVSVYQDWLAILDPEVTFLTL